jgi:type I restriction enzyme S subunit
MEVKKGYKQTEVGILPNDWDAKPLCGLVSILHGFGFKGDYFKDSGTYRLTTPGHFNENGGFRDVGEKQKFYDGIVPDGYVLNEDDIIIAMTEQADGLLGSAAIIPIDGVYLHNQRLGKLKVTCSGLFGLFLYRVFNSPYYRAMVRETAAGTKVKHTSPSKLLEIPIPLPPTLAEQEAIAGALSDADAWIESLDQLIAKKRQIKQGAMQELLTGKRRLPGFSGEWETKRLGEFLVSHPQYGINAAAVPYSDKLPVYIRITDITEYGQYGPNPRVCVQASAVSGYFLADGDLVVARTGASVGKSYRYRIADGPLVFAGFLIRIRPNAQQLNPRFLEGYVAGEKYWNWVRLMSMRSGQPGINGNEYAQLPIELPSIAEQTAIATVLSDMDTEIESLESKLAKACEIKQGMMQELLTGKIRLV